MICIGQIKGGTHDSRSLYIVHASKKKDQLSKKKTGGLHLDRFGFGRGGGVGLCWLCLARAFSGSKE